MGVVCVRLINLFLIIFGYMVRRERGGGREREKKREVGKLPVTWIGICIRLINLFLVDVLKSMTAIYCYVNRTVEKFKLMRI